MIDRKIGFLGSYVPRQCGLATFTADALTATALNGVQAEAIVVEDFAGDYRYPAEVKRTFRQHDRRDYVDVARWINGRHYDCLSVQHEYGIYGGEAGHYLLELISRVHCPVVTTLHTILEKPSPRQRSVLERLIRLSDRVICMTETGRRILLSTYDVTADKIDVIAHGIPSVLSRDPQAAKAALGWRERYSIFTFGLLSPDKGIDDMIRALPQIIADHPDTVYTVCGVTHPHIRAVDGEKLRESLLELADSLGVSKHIRFENRFVSQEELTVRLQACDLYVTPYRNMNQITSGTLAYAFGCGNAVISTPYWHAAELLASERGILVSPSDSEALGQAVVDILNDESRRKSIQIRALELGKAMQWPAIGKRYVELFESVRTPQILSLSPHPTLPENKVLGLDFLLSLVDDVGIYQHAKYGIPTRGEGYCLDDCARAALVLARVAEPTRETEKALRANLSFIAHALNSSDKECPNFMGFDRRWLQTDPSDDAVGRAVWALGSIIGASRSEDHSPYHDFAVCTLKDCIHRVDEIQSVRAKATALLGLTIALRFGIDGFASRMHRTGRELHSLWRENARPDWPWFEPLLSYDNAHLPAAMIATGRVLGDDAMVNDGLIALDWLCVMQTSIGGVFRPIGSNGFYPREGEPALFDQQPLEAWTTLEAARIAYLATGDSLWLNVAESVFAWFLGQNDLEVSMIDPITGGAYDGLTPCGPNRNQGAESAISLVGSAQVIEDLRSAKAMLTSKAISSDPTRM